jgi:hypothetical protein
MAEGIRIIAILVAGGNHQHAEADDVCDLMPDLHGFARIDNGSRKVRGDANALLDLTQCQQTTIGGEAIGVELGNDRLVGDG